MTIRVLVIDDDPILTRVVTFIATRLGFKVGVVNNPRDAIDAFLDFKPEVTMIDMLMPEYDGIDVLNEILLTGITTKLIVMAEYNDAYLGLASGVAKFHDAKQIAVLHKPFRRDELAILLEQLAGPIRRQASC